MLTIDGSMGEGGGQILRTSLGLSLVTGRPFRIEKIRAARRKPGLMAQHLTCVRAAAAVGDAEIRGATKGSLSLSFAPKTIRPGEYTYKVGTAGSTTLVLQTVLPALITASAPSRLVLEGGTHNPFAPPFDFLERVYLPLLERMGPRVDAKLSRAGFFPAGGGRFRVMIQPSASLAPLELLERGSLRGRRAVARVSRLPRHVAERELKVARRALGWPTRCAVIEEIDSPGPGNVLLLEIESEHVRELITGFGQRGVRAEEVAANAAAAALRYLHSDAPVGEHLADQLLLLQAVAGGGRFRTLPPTLHTRTNAQVIQRFLGVKIAMIEGSEGSWWVEVTRAG